MIFFNGSPVLCLPTYFPVSFFLSGTKGTSIHCKKLIWKKLALSFCVLIAQITQIRLTIDELIDNGGRSEALGDNKCWSRGESLVCPGVYHYHLSGGVCSEKSLHYHIVFSLLKNANTIDNG